MITTNIVFFRNDDVDLPQPGLIEMTQAFLDRGIPLSHGVVPSRLSGEVELWLRDLSGSGAEVIQHGFSHANYGRGEFGGRRSYPDQLRDMREGKLKLQDRFAEQFFPAFSFPYHAFNGASLRALDELGFKVCSSYFGLNWQRRLINRAGLLLGLDHVLGRGVSHHVGRVPRTRLLEVSVSVSPIRGSLGDYESVACSYESLETLQATYRAWSKRSPILGIELHHRYYGTQESLMLLMEFVDWLSSQDGIRFCRIREIHEMFVGEAGASPGKSAPPPARTSKR